MRDVADTTPATDRKPRVCAKPGCGRRPYGLNSVLRTPVPTCKLHTECSEAGCGRMVGKHGCAPAALGRPLCKSHYSRWELYGSTGEHTRKQRADKGSYRIPDRLEDSVAGHPLLAKMFIKNVDIPARDARATSLHANNRVEWQCLNQTAHPSFVAKPLLLMRAGMTVTRQRSDGTPYTYTYPEIACPRCSHANRAAARRKSLRSRLATARPELAAQFVANLTTPGAGPENIQPKSRDVVRWRCPCGAHVDRAPLRITAGAATTVLCRDCRRPGESMLEWQVAYLMEEASGLTVTRQRKIREWHVDLYVTELDVSFDIDPHYTHRHDERLRTDRRKVAALAGVDYRRVRERPLSRLAPRDLSLVAQATAVDYAEAMLGVVRARGVAATTVTPEMAARALAATRVAWVAAGETIGRAHPDHAALVLACVDDPQLDWRTAPLRALLPLRFEVRCPTAGHPTRTVLLRGWLQNRGLCRQCPTGARPPTAARYPLSAVPEARELFRRLRDHPEADTGRVGRTSQRIAIFACLRCGADHERAVGSWVRGRKLCDACLTVMRRRRWAPETQ